MPKLIRPMVSGKEIEMNNNGVERPPVLVLVVFGVLVLGEVVCIGALVAGCVSFFFNLGWGQIVHHALGAGWLMIVSAYIIIYFIK